MTFSKELRRQEQEVAQSGVTDINDNRLDFCAARVEETRAPVLSVKIVGYNPFLVQLRETGKILRADRDQPPLSVKPAWFDEALFKNARSVYERHFMGINFAHLSGLLLLVRVDSIYRTLSKTGESDTVANLFKRYYHTVRHVKSWYEGDIFEANSLANRSLMIVRGLHNKVSCKFNESMAHVQSSKKMADEKQPEPSTCMRLLEEREPRYDDNDGGARVHLSEYDIMITQFAFVGLIVLNANKTGLINDFSRRDLESLLHFWRVIGFYLGASEKYNLCSYAFDDIVGLCQAIAEVEYVHSLTKTPLDAPPGVMSVNIVRSVKFIPMLTVYGIMRHLYEILGCEIAEIGHKESWYSKLSYTLIKLVMTNLLGYRPLRAFNNGLTRLSLYCVGKVEDWFYRRLMHQYGEELKA